MRYALLAYSDADAREQRSAEDQRRIDAGVAAVLARPDVTGWLRLHLGGFILVEAEDLDGALAVAAELQALQGTRAIEVRPVREEPPGA
jgi:hypothetical protein